MLKLKFLPPSCGSARFNQRLIDVFFVTGISLFVAAAAISWGSHGMFDEILSPQSSPQALHMMAIWNVLMYFIPGTMAVTGASLSLVTPVLIRLCHLCERLLDLRLVRTRLPG
ncbi:hypothetical protein ACQPT2_21315 [Erwinia amylovora]